MVAMARKRFQTITFDVLKDCLKNNVGDLKQGILERSVRER
jgi:hypothetical protein